METLIALLITFGVVCAFLVTMMKFHDFDEDDNCELPRLSNIVKRCVDDETLDVYVYSCDTHQWYEWRHFVNIMINDTPYHHDKHFNKIITVRNTVDETGVFDVKESAITGRLTDVNEV